MIAVIAVVLAITLGGGGDGGGVAGKYYDIEEGELLELKADGTFTMGEFGFAEGTYRVDGNRIYLKVSYLGYEVEGVGTIEGKRLTIEGDVYEKK